MKKLSLDQQEIIYHTIVINSNKIVLLDVLGIKKLSNEELNKNIYCVDDDFNIIWIIDPEKTKFDIDSFTSMKKATDGKIHARRFSGFEYEINPNTGEAKMSGWNK